MLDFGKAFHPRDVVYFLGGFLCIGLVAINLALDLTPVGAIGAAAVPFVAALAYVVGYSIQEIGSFLPFFKTAQAFRATPLDRKLVAIIVPDAESSNYDMLTPTEKTQYSAIGYKNDVVERIQFLRSICQVSGMALLIAGICGAVHQLIELSWQMAICLAIQLAVGVFLIFRARIEAMQSQHYIRIAIANNLIAQPKPQNAELTGSDDD